MARMLRIADQMPAQERPIIQEYLLDRSRLPPEFRTGMPLLRVVFPERFFFDTDRTELRPEGYAPLRLIAEALRREIPDVAVFIAGHADSRGSEDHNLGLSIARAETVATRLNEMGVGGVALWRIGFGESVPLFPNDSEPHMAANRRVEFIFGARAEVVAAWLARQNVCATPDSRARPCPGSRPGRTFVADVVSRRTGLALPQRRPRAVEPPRRPRRSLPGPSHSPTAVASAVAEAGARIPIPDPQRTSIAPLARPRIVIDLHTRRYSVPTLEPR